MQWIDDKESDMLSAVSQSKNKKDLVADLLEIFNKIHNEEIFQSNEILIFVDATNGSIFFSGLDKHQGNPIDSLTIFFQAPEIWEMHLEDASEFDELVISSIKKRLRTVKSLRRKRFL